MRVLTDLNIGESGMVTHYNPSDDNELRLVEMGIVNGEKVRLTKIAPLGDPLEIEIMNYSLCIRKENAKKIWLIIQ